LSFDVLVLPLIEALRIVDQLRGFLLCLTLEQYFNAGVHHAVVSEKADKKPGQHEVPALGAKQDRLTLQPFEYGPEVGFVRKGAVG
jgi:hypothetical protein